MHNNKLFYVFKEKYDRYMEDRGMIIWSKNGEDAKKVWRAEVPFGDEEDMDNVIAQEINLDRTNVKICNTNYINNVVVNINPQISSDIED